MDIPRKASGSDRRRPAGSSPAEEESLDVPRILLTLEDRLHQLERTSQAVESRLQAIEQRLAIAASASAPPTVAPVAARQTEPAATAAIAPVAVSPSPPQLVERQSRSEPATLELPLGERQQVGRRPARAAARKRPALALDDLERAISGRGLAWAGGLTLLLGALFFLSLAISRGWIGIEARVVVGLVAGIVVTVLGDRLIRGGDRVLGPVLVAVGVGIWSLALVAGTRLYEFIPFGLALLGSAAGAGVAVAIAVRTNAQVIAVYGIVTALAAPMLFAVPEAELPMAYLLVILVGSTIISYRKGWVWLPPVAFVLTQMQFYGWWQATGWPGYTGRSISTSLAEVLLVLVGMTLCHAMGAVGMEFSTRGRGRVPAGVLLVLNAMSFAYWGGTTIAHGLDADVSRIGLGAFLLLGAGAFAGLGVFVMRRRGEISGFAYMAYAIAAALLTCAIPAFCEGHLLAVAWAAEAVGFVWLATRYRNGAGFIGAALTFFLTIMHLFIVEFPSLRPWEGPRRETGMPFLNEAGLTLLAVLGLMVLAGSIVRQQLARVAIAMIGIGLLLAVLPREVAGFPLLIGWAMLTVLAFAADRYLAAPELSAAARADRVLAWCEVNGLKVVGAVGATLAIHRAVIFEMPVLRDAPFENRMLYVGQPVAATAIIVVAAVAVAILTMSDRVRQIAGAVAILITAHFAAFMFSPATAVAIWALLAVVASVLQPVLPGSDRVYLATSGSLLLLGAAVTLASVAPPSRLFLMPGAANAHPFLWSGATLALGVLALAFLFIARELRGTAVSQWLAVIGGALGVYLLSVGIVDAFQAQVTPDSVVSELRRQSQMALSITWALLGGGAILAGLARHHATARWFGLGLFAIAMLKAFLYDLSSLDAIYRVLSFIALGVLLLLSAYAYRWFERKGEAEAATVFGEPMGGTEDA